jgi:hypothetical protein
MLFPFYLDILLISFACNAVIFYITKNITFFGDKGATDNEKMLIAATKHSLLSYPSKLHLIENARAQLREFWVIFLVIIAKFFKLKTSEAVNIALSLISNSFNSFLIFIIFIEIFNYEIAIFAFLFYLTSFWSYQIAIYLGHILFSTTWCLLSIFLITKLNYDLTYLDLIISLFVGVTLVICFSSSSASRKYPPFIVFFYIYDFFNKNLEKINLENIAVFFSYLIIGSLIFIILKFLSTIIIRKILNFNSAKNSDLKKMTIKQIINYILIFTYLISFNSLCFVIFKNFSLLIYSLVSFLGSVLVIIYLLYPDFKDGIKRYLIYLNIGYWANHFQAYPKDFFKINDSKNFRGGNYSWIYKMFFRLIPIVLVIYLSSFIICILYSSHSLNTILINNIISLTPLIVIEITKGIRVGKSYFPCLIGFIFGIGYNLNYLFYEINLFTSQTISLFTYFVIISNFLLSLYVLATDILPSRMFQINLKNYLIKNKIISFATYKNPYMQGTINPMLDSNNNFKVEYVDSIKDCKSNFFICPPISSKSVSFETNKHVIKNGDLNSDTVLNKILKDDNNKNYIIKDFKTFGSSRYYVLESEVTGYRELGLQEITDYDRYLGKCRIISMKDLPDEILL